MGVVLASLIGKKVMVRSNSADDEHCDEGIIEAYDGEFLLLRGSTLGNKCKLLYIRVGAIRLIEPIGNAEDFLQESKLLLRASQAPTTAPEQLLRPVQADLSATDPAVLLRASQERPDNL